MEDQTQKILNVLMVKAMTDENFSRDKLISDIKRLLAGESPENLLSQDAEIALLKTKQECVQGVHTSISTGRL